MTSSARQNGWEKRVPEFWFREGRLRGGGSPAYQKFQVLYATAARSAQSSRQRWLARNSADVEERMHWAEQHLPPALLFVRAESSLLALSDSAGNMYCSAFGGLGVKNAEVQRHVNSIIDLDAVLFDAKRVILFGSSAQVPADLLRDLKQMADQISKLLSHLNSVYRLPPFPLVGCIGLLLGVVYLAYYYFSH